MSVTQSTSEKFDTLMESVSTRPVHAPTAILEGRQAKIKKPPLSDTRKKIDEKIESKKKSTVDSKKKLNEAAELISDLYSKYILEGVLDEAKGYNPEMADKIESMKIALSEAALSAKDFLV